MILSGNSIEHGLLALAAMYAGIPYAPIAPAYSLAVKEFAALSHVWRNFGPAMVFADDGARFAPALRAVSRGDAQIVHHSSRPDGMSSIFLAELESCEPSAAVDEANRRTGPDPSQKFCIPPGSTGLPKGVITTHRMLCSNQEMLLQMMPSLGDAPPVLCDWLPWNHTFGGSHNFGIALYNGGSLYIDAGRPTPELFGETLRNLREIATTAYFNVPKGYEMLVGHLRSDAALRKNFFSRLNLLFFAAAGLSQHIWDALQDLAYRNLWRRNSGGHRIGRNGKCSLRALHGKGRRLVRLAGIACAGRGAKACSVEEKLEARLRGPSITPGFWRRPEMTAAAFRRRELLSAGRRHQVCRSARPAERFPFRRAIERRFQKFHRNLGAGWPDANAPAGSFRKPCARRCARGARPGFTTAMFFPALQACRAFARACRQMPLRGNSCAARGSRGVSGAAGFLRLRKHRQYYSR